MVGIGDTTPLATLTVGNGDLFQVAGATGNITTAGDAAINGGDITTTGTTFNLVNATATTLNIGGAGTTISIGAGTGTTTINNATTAITGNVTVGGTTGITASGIGAGLTFSGTGNHDITAASGTLRIGSNTIIGNVEALDNTVDIGTAATRFDKIYATEVNATSLVGNIVGGNVLPETLTINSDNATADTEDANLAFERGTTSPNALMTYDSTNDEFDFNTSFHITGTIKADPYIIFNAATASDTDFWISLQEDGGGDDDDTFQIGKGTTPGTTPYLTINASGNLGIGTTAPITLLTIGSGTPTTAASGLNFGTDTSANLYRSAAATIKTDGNFVVAGTGNSSLAGNVGIGTTGPGSKLDVTTAGLAATQTTTSGLALVNTTAATAVAPQQISPAIRFSGFGWKTDVTAASQAVDFRAFVTPVQGTAAPTGYLGFGSAVNGGAYSDNQLVITTTGNVGIGTTAPITLLTIGSGTPTTAANGLNFGTDASANLYRSAAATIKTDGALVVAGNLTVTGTAWTATPTISGLITATSGLTANGTVTVAAGFSQTGANTFGTGTGAVSLNGATTVTGSNTFATGTGTVTLNNVSTNIASSSPVIDLTSATTLSINTVTNRPITFGTGLITLPGNFSQTGTTTFGTGTGAVSLNGDTTVAAGKNLALASGAGTLVQTFTGTTTTALTVTANSLTTGSLSNLTSSNNSAANTAWSANQLNVTNAQGTTAISTGSIAGLDLQFTQNTSVAGNTETAARFAIKQNDSSSTDATVVSILSLENNDTSTGNQIVVTDGLKIVAGTASNITNGINLSGTFATNLITSTNFVVSQAGNITAVSTDIGGGYGSTGVTITSAGNISANGTLTVDGHVTLESVTSTGATGTGALVFATSPNLVTPALGAATYTTLSGGNITDSALTATRVTFAGTAGILQDDSDLTFATDTLSATKLLSSTSVSTPSLISTGAVGITPAAGSNLNVSLSTTGDFAVNTNQLYVDTSAASVGIGTTAPASILHISDASKTVASGNTNIFVLSNDSQAVDKGGSISLGGVYTGTSTAPFGYVWGRKENSTDNNQAGYLAFGTRAATPATSEWMRITSTGNVGIGTTTVSAKLHTLATTEQLRLGYDASNYVSFTVASTGALTVAGTTSAAAGSNITITPGAATADSAGGTLTLNGGAAAAAAGSAGGPISIAAAAGTSTGTGGAGGALTLTAGNAGGDNTVNRQGGAVSITAGNSKKDLDGGAVTITAGTAGAGVTAGGAITLQAGAAGAAAGSAGGAVSVLAAAGSSTGTGGNGGALTITAGAAGGDGTVNRNGGAINITAGKSTGAGTSGALTLTAGTGSSTGTGSIGADITLNGGAAGAIAGSAGGGAYLTSANGSSTGTGGAGGALTITAGAAGGDGTTNRTGGSININAGKGVGASTGGNITLLPGTGSTTGAGSAGGYVSLTGGAAGAIAGSAGGAAELVAANGSTTGSGGAGGAITILAGNAGGDGTANRAGGTVVITAGKGVGVSTGGAITVTAGTGSSTGAGSAGGDGTTNRAAGAVSITAGNAKANVAGGAITLTGGTGGAGGSIADGGAITLQGGTAGAVVSGDGGGISILGGVGSSTGAGGSGGALTLTAGNSGGDGTGNNPGGAISITAGAGKGNAAGGAVNITGGTSSVTGCGVSGCVGGALTLQAGGGSTAGGGAGVLGHGGAVSISAGTGSSTGVGGNGGAFTITAGSAGGDGTANNTAGALSITAGDAKGNVAGGAITLTAGTGGAGGSLSTGGAITLQAGTAGAVAAAAGGGISILAAAGSSTGSGGAGGALTLTAGSAGGDNTVNRAGGNITLTGGNSKLAGTAGFVELVAGNATNGNNNGGNIYITGGALNGSGTNGNVILGVTSGGTARGNVGIGTTTAGGTLTILSTNATGVTTSSALNLSANSLTTGTGLYAASSTLTSGSLFDLAVTGTAAASNTQKVLNIATSGANATATQTTYGAYLANTHTGTTSTNVGLYATASGGTNNYAAIFAAGNVGIGLTTPAQALDVSGSIQLTGNFLPSAAPTAGASSQTITTVDTGDGTHIAITVGTDGFPVIAYNNGSGLALTKCGNAACSSGNATTALDTSAAGVGIFNSIAIGTDGFPVIAYRNNNGDFQDLKVIKCGNAACSSGNTTTLLDTTGNVGEYTSIAIGRDGMPVISYYDSTNGDLRVAYCTNASCTAATKTSVDTTNNVGQYTSLKIGVDGLPFIAYVDVTNGRVRVTHCGKVDCSSGNTSTTVGDTPPSGNIKYTSVAIHRDGPPQIAYYTTVAGDLHFIECQDQLCGASYEDVNADSTNDVGQYTSIAIGPSGLPMISYYDVTNADLRVAFCKGIYLGNRCNTGWVITSIDTTGDVGQYTSIAIAPDGLPFIAYYDVTNTDLKTVKCALPDCSQTAGGSYTAGSNIGTIGTYFNNIYANSYWGKQFQIAAFDVAEEYEVDRGDIAAGEVMCLSSHNPDPESSSGDSESQSGDPETSSGLRETNGHGGMLTRCDENNNSVLGVVSTKPAVILGDWGEETKPSNVRAIALVGRVPVKVTEENGAIKEGDYLTLSRTLPGYAMKMTTSGQAIGIALEASNGTGTVLTFINLSYQYISVSEDELGKLITDDFYDFGGYAINNVKSIASISGKWSISEDGVLIVVEVHTDKLCLGETCVTESQLKALLGSSGSSSSDIPDTPSVLGDSTGPEEEPPATEEPAAEEPVAEEPVVEETPAEQPATEAPAEEPSPEAAGVEGTT